MVENFFKIALFWMMGGWDDDEDGGHGNKEMKIFEKCELFH